MQTEATFDVEYLSEEQCWQLFQHYAFGGTNQDVRSEFLEIGKQIVKKCGMLPLVLKSIASLLRYEATNEDSPREILENELWESEVSDD